MSKRQEPTEREAEGYRDQRKTAKVLEESKDVEGRGEHDLDDASA